MLVVANGTMKSGSSWLYWALHGLTGFPGPPAEYREPTWRIPSLVRGRLQAFLESGLHRQASYLVKNHFSQPDERELLLGDPDVRVCDVQREERDALVSMYFHDLRAPVYVPAEVLAQKPDLGLQEWLAGWGRQFLRDLWRYRTTWAPAHERLFATRFEELHRDAEGELRRMSVFLGLACPETQIAEVARATSFETLSEGRPPGQEDRSSHFRKGVIGDHRNHFDHEVWATYCGLVEELAVVRLKWTRPPKAPPPARGLLARARAALARRGRLGQY